MGLPLTKAAELIQQHEAALLDDSVRFSDRQLQDLADAITVLLKTADMEQRGLLYMLMNRVRRRQGRLPEALDAAKNAFRTDTTSAHYANCVSAAFGELGQHKGAMEFADRAERLLRLSPNPDLELTIALNQAAARAALGVGDADEAIVRAAGHAVASPVDGNLKIAAVLASLGRFGEALEFLARHLCARQGIDRGAMPAAAVVRSAPSEMIAQARFNEALAAVIEAAMISRADDDPGAPTPDEVARATEAARDEDGDVDPYALLEALAAPRAGGVPSSDRTFRFQGDVPMLRSMRDDA